MAYLVPSTADRAASRRRAPRALTARSRIVPPAPVPATIPPLVASPIVRPAPVAKSAYVAVNPAAFSWAGHGPHRRTGERDGDRVRHLRPRARSEVGQDHRLAGTRSQRADGRRLGGCDRQRPSRGRRGLRGCRSGTHLRSLPATPGVPARKPIEGGRTAPEYLGDRRETAARALGVEAPPICIVDVHELRVLADLAEDPGRAGTFRLLAAGRLHAEDRKPAGGGPASAEWPNRDWAESRVRGVDHRKADGFAAAVTRVHDAPHPPTRRFGMRGKLGLLAAAVVGAPVSVLRL